MSDFDRAECERLLAKAHAALASGLPGGSGLYGDDLAAMADQLEAARAEIDSLKTAMEVAQRAAERRGAERDLLRAVFYAAERWNGVTSPLFRDHDALSAAVDTYHAARDKAERCDECDPSFTTCFNDRSKCVKRPPPRDEESDYEKRNRELHRLGRLAGKP